ncbi:MAG: hypothetical protein INR66_12430 [Gordonia polyisoprenivorans]|nr:hypothetical protein [Gordonia polyisoprenivorans]
MSRRYAVPVGMAVLVVSACSSGSGGVYAPVPTRTTTSTPATSVIDPGNVVGVRNFVVQPSYSCLDGNPRRAIVTVGWTAPSATGVSLSLDGRRLPAGLNNPLPYQVPAGGPKGIGATVAFACDGATQHSITIDWTAAGLTPASRTVTIVKDADNG